MAANRPRPQKRGTQTAPQAVPTNPSRHQECALCLEQYKSPRILPCFHTFCLVCLERLTQNSPRTGCFPCPSCRTSVQIPQGGVAKFQVNFYVEAAIESQQSGQGSSVRMCDMCGQQTATSKCTECDQFACDNCTEIHARIGATRSHTVLNLNAQNQASPLVVKERYCDTHKDEKIRFFCTQCNCVLCRDCKLTSHEGHSTTDLSKRSQAAKKMLLSVTKKTRESLKPKLKHALKAAEKHREDLDIKQAEILSTFHQRAENIKKKVEACLKQEEQNLSCQSRSIRKNVTKTIDDMQQQIACLESLCDHAEQVAKTGCDADILSLPAEMVQFFGESAGVRVFRGPNQNQYYYGNNSAYAPRLFQQINADPNNTRLNVFFNENWQQTIELSDFSNDTYNQHCGYVAYNASGGENVLQGAISSNIGKVTTISKAESTNQCAWAIQHPVGYGGLINRQKGFSSGNASSAESTVDIQGISGDISDIQQQLSNWTSATQVDGFSNDEDTNDGIVFTM